MELKGLRALTARLQGMAARANKQDVVAVGFLGNSSYPDGTPTATVAAIQEFGTASIPSRPFFRNMVAKDSPTWGASMHAVLSANGYDVEKTLGGMGLLLEGQLRASIVALTDPPLAPATIAARLRRGRGKSRKPPSKTIEKPLIDTGHMLASIGSTVEKPE